MSYRILALDVAPSGPFARPARVCGASSTPMRGAVTVSSTRELKLRLTSSLAGTMLAITPQFYKSESVKPSSEVTTKERRAAAEARTVWQCDDSFTRRVMASAATDYYDRSSYWQFLEAIAMTLLIYALDHPLVPRSSSRLSNMRASSDPARNVPIRHNGEPSRGPV